ncbi:MAG: acyltransferase family protein [Actinomycetota bacterium]|nr:acyltransferase family protein [Actinomycetota bacterium]
MPSQRPLTAEEVHRLTPPDRNRFADLLRVISIIVVVIGHWLIAVVAVSDGEWVTGRLLEFVPATRWATWVFQVMPLFFFVGGYANAASWSATAGRDVPWAVWVRRRSRRLLRPVVPLLALWVPLAVLLGLAGVPGELLQLGTQVAFIPAWFLAAYVLVVAAARATFAAHRRWGLGALAGLVAVAIAVDAAHLSGVPVVGYTNFFWVWVAVHQLGYFWYDSRLPGSFGGPGLAIGGYAVLAVLTTVGGYPVAMIGVEPGQRSNNSPTSIALFVLGVAQFGVVAAVRDPVERWLRHSRAWAWVVAAGAVAMTVYLWHQTALVVVAALTIPTGIWPETGVADLRWWSLRPLWLVLCGLVLVVLVRVFARFERVGEPRSRSGRVRAAVGVVATTAGIGLLLAGGLYDPAQTAGMPLTALGLLFAGLGALGVIRNHPAAELRTAEPTEQVTGP